ncbi:hypothetical protein FKP32DRAFT_1585261 [Trametes sanguinea]|nr:hypothetical protein FKP32DRAFT_1585261 [Trametes sanguinea]
MLARIVEVVEAAEAEEGDIELGDPLPLNWAEGVEAYRKLTITQMQAAFALPTAHLPFFNKKTDMVSNEDPWSDAGREALKAPNAADLTPFWHQWIGIMKIVDNMMDGKNILLMDQVGVGKTLQATGALAMYEWLRVHKQTRGDYPTRFHKPPTSFDTPTRESRSIDQALRKITIYSRQFGVVIFDEAHTARKAGPVQISTAELSRRSILAMVMTATPIVTSPMVR